MRHKHEFGGNSPPLRMGFDPFNNIGKQLASTNKESIFPFVIF